MGSKFKVGDRVRLIKDGKSTDGAVGKMATLVEWSDGTFINEGDYLLDIDPPVDYKTAAVTQNFTRAPASSFELIPSHPIGQRVVLSQDNEGYGVKGDAGVVVATGEEVRVRFDRDIRGQREWLVSAGRLNEEKWAPKVGDRVRYKNPTLGEATIVEIVGPDYVKVNTHGIYGICTEALSDLQPLPIAAPQSAASPTNKLSIEAGKFYKTRDGRKVGPMVKSDRWWTFTGLGGGNPGHYAANGFSAYMGILPRDELRAEWDLIAEWQEPAVIKAKYVGAQSAQVDAIADEYGPFIDTSAMIAKALGSNDNAPKFKVGDRVKFRDNYGTSARGKEATVLKLGVWGGDGIQVDQGGRYGVSTERAADLRPIQTPAIVALIENGTPAPSATPKVHASEAEATVEAERLAGLYRGQRFGVFVLVDTRETDKPVYDHEWQQLAIDGQKIAAIKAIRALTGFGLKAAKDGVEDWLGRQPIPVADWLRAA